MTQHADPNPLRDGASDQTLNTIFSVPRDKQNVDPPWTVVSQWKVIGHNGWATCDFSANAPLAERPDGTCTMMEFGEFAHHSRDTREFLESLHGGSVTLFPDGVHVSAPPPKEEKADYSPVVLSISRELVSAMEMCPGGLSNCDGSEIPWVHVSSLDRWIVCLNDSDRKNLGNHWSQKLIDQFDRAFVEMENFDWHHLRRIANLACCTLIYFNWSSDAEGTPWREAYKRLVMCLLFRHSGSSTPEGYLTPLQQAEGYFKMMVQLPEPYVDKEPPGEKSVQQRPDHWGSFHHDVLELRRELLDRRGPV